VPEDIHIGQVGFSEHLRSSATLPIGATAHSFIREELRSNRQSEDVKGFLTHYTSSFEDSFQQRSAFVPETFGKRDKQDRVRDRNPDRHDRAHE